jgi:hypothetical protein
MKLTKLIIPLIAITVVVFSISTAAAGDKDMGGDAVDFLFVQYAKSVTLGDDKANSLFIVCDRNAKG